jgi:diguanylate cyclase (GGDEF)-like protein/PAS domain S-box-containing protein
VTNVTFYNMTFVGRGHPVFPVCRIIGAYSIIFFKRAGISKYNRVTPMLSEPLDELLPGSRRMVEALNDLFVVLSPDRHILLASAGVGGLFGLTAESLVGMEFNQLAAKAEQESLVALFEALAAPPHSGVFSQLAGAPGGGRWLEWSFTAVLDPDGQIEALIGVGHDVTDRRRLESLLQRTIAVVQNTRDGVVVTDAETLIVSVNAAFTNITHYQAADVVGRSFADLLSKRHSAAFLRSVWDTARTVGKWQGSLWSRRKDGEVYPLWLTITMIPDRFGKPGQYVGVLSAQLQDNQADSELKQLHHDPLTNLPNRLWFHLQLEHALQRTQYAHKQLGLLYVDIDRFKDVNDTFGYDAGDQMLIDVAHRMKGTLREVDVLSRISGDEFAILIENVSDSNDLTNIAFHLKECFVDPFTLQGQEVYASASIGISIYPKDGETADALVKNAVTASRRAKRVGRNTCQFYTSGLNASAFERMVLMSKLRKALERGEFSLSYQPYVHIGSGRMAGVEALLRWRNPDLGLIPPARFIPLAEESGIIRTVGAWVLETACRQLQDWLAQGLSIGQMSVNVAQLQFQRADFPLAVGAALRTTGLNPAHLVLEVTESSVMSDAQQALEVIHRLRAMGIRFAIDDFGTGYSSLAYLKNLPIDILKLDQSFVTRVTYETGNLAITRAVIAMGRALNLEVLAEGVETASQREVLLREGCQYGQGFYYSPPVEAEKIKEILKLYPGQH